MAAFWSRGGPGGGHSGYCLYYLPVLCGPELQTDRRGEDRGGPCPVPADSGEGTVTATRAGKDGGGGHVGEVSQKE